MENKSLGVVFTPKNISEYMSKLLIYHYLTQNLKNNDEIKNLVCKNKRIKNQNLNNKIYDLLKNIKILEPSIGEGALLVELANLLIKIIYLLNKKTKNTKTLILNSLYGYEINNESLLIAKKNLLEVMNLKDFSFKFITGDFLEYNLKNKIKEKFDLIIANPPYIKEKENKNLFEPLKRNEYYQGRMDIWYMFMQYSLDISSKNGIITYIIPNNWTSNSGASKLRNSMKNKTMILSIIDFNNYHVFKNAAIQTMILTLKKEKSKEKYHCYYKKMQEIEDINNFLNFRNLIKTIVKNNSSNLTFTKINITNLLDKIEITSNFKLIRRKEVTQGIVHPQNTVSNSNLLNDNNLKLNEGVFVINKLEKMELKINNKEKKVIKTTYTTKELKKYFKYGKPKFWTIYIDKSFNKIEKIKEYPNIKKHLDKFANIITSDNKPYGLHRPRNEYFFVKGGKILVSRKSKIPTFTYLEEECYPTFTFNVIKSERIDLKYLTMLLNSKLILFWLKYRGKLQGRIFQIDIEPLLRLPIINNTIKTSILRQKYNKLGEKKIIDKKIINEVDNIIYEIYGLTSQEIDIIERDIKESYEKYPET